MSAVPEERIYTMADIEALPEGQRAELVDGRIYMMAPPKVSHDRIVFRMGTVLDQHIMDKRLPCEVFSSNVGVFIENDGGVNFFQPDLKVVCDGSKVGDDGIHGAPDFIVEVLSKSTKAYDMVDKLRWYRDAGVREYWMVDPKKRKVHTHVFIPEYDAETFSFDDDIPVSICPGFSMNLRKMGF